MFAPPVNRAMKVLDRSFFQKTVPTSAARIFNAKDISRCRTELEKSHDALKSRISLIRPDPDESRAQKGGRCLLLRPEIAPNGMTYPARDTQKVLSLNCRQIGLHGAPSCRSLSRAALSA